ncbi:hypothetical protein SKAU_G00350000 [Synaphobranchus kaupii]|uniref:Uncharacterized protein n=1 Tax=Synaphobranchus kaupii TaxID=118154 RepID=A0A9Q1IHU7_SYNKA|nr:hypothetical protein SKAU_G00350000 [Synaphobranchus kaupii]
MKREPREHDCSLRAPPVLQNLGVLGQVSIAHRAEAPCNEKRGITGTRRGVQPRGRRDTARVHREMERSRDHTDFGSTAGEHLR